MTLEPNSQNIHYYQIYGLRVSSSISIPGMLPAPAEGSIDVEIHLDNAFPDFVSTAEELWYTSDDEDAHGNILLRVWKLTDSPHYRFQFGDGAEFLIDQTGTTVWARWPDILTIDDISSYVYGPLLGFVLRLRGTIALHASAIIIDGQAVAIVGKSGRGKSTTAAALAERGYACISDDVVALYEHDHAFYVYPGYPRVKLWPESVNMIFGSAEALPRVLNQTKYWQHWDKRYLDLLHDDYRFPLEPHPLAAIYLMKERSDDPQTPYIQTVPPGNSLLDLVTNTFTNYLLDRAIRSSEFNLLGVLVDRVHIRHLQPQSNPDKLDDLCDALLEDAASILKTG